MYRKEIYATFLEVSYELAYYDPRQKKKDQTTSGIHTIRRSQCNKKAELCTLAREINSGNKAPSARIARQSYNAGGRARGAKLIRLSARETILIFFGDDVESRVQMRQRPDVDVAELR